MNDIPEAAPPDDEQEAVARLLKDEADGVELDPGQMLIRMRGQVSQTPQVRPHRKAHIVLPLGAVAAAAALIVAFAGGWSPFSAELTPAPPASTRDSGEPNHTADLQFTPTDEVAAFSLSQDRDWVIVGQDPDAPLQIARADVQEQLLGIGDSGITDPTSKASPLSVPYSDGQTPSASGVATRWLAADSRESGERSRIDVRVQPGRDRGVVTVYLGSQDATTTAQILLDQETVLTREQAPSGGQGVELAVDLSDYPDDQQVIVRLLAGEGGSVSVAGARLSK